ncbi:MAG: transglycosylase domain-containing protein [Quinella sp. 1Q5]|nr:transglycosylase domain-containing protein [Quinella sp. 1Q5]
MSNDKPKRSFRIIFKLIKFIIAMVLTFFISFAVTLYLKSDDPADQLDFIADEIFSKDKPIKRGNAPEIKTLFDEQNKQPFDPSKYNSNKKVSTDTTSPKAEELGVLDSVDRMTSIKPAVDEKIRDLPHYVTIDKLPPTLCQAVIAVEDNRFYKHKGFDFIGIARAVFVNVEAGEIQEGASTITQQTVKNLFLTSDQTFTRKAEELVLAMNMEKDFDKDKILEIYLNVIYFGSNFYGIYDAAQGYFAKEPAELSIAECAMLAGLPNAPSVYSPYVDFHLAKQRQLIVIDAMEKTGVISTREAESARIEEIILAR